MTRGQRIGIIASVVWIIVIFVIAIRAPKERFFFIFYFFGAVPVAILVAEFT
jgi:hypothetical protein